MQHGWTGLGRPQGVRLVSEGSICWGCRRAPATRLAVLSRVLVLEKVFMNNKYNADPGRPRDATPTGRVLLLDRLSLVVYALEASRSVRARRRPRAAPPMRHASRPRPHAGPSHDATIGLTTRARGAGAPAGRPARYRTSTLYWYAARGLWCEVFARAAAAIRPEPAQWCGARTGRGANKAHHADVTWC